MKRKANPVPWLDRSLIIGPYLCLCTTEKDYHAVMDYLKVPAHQRRPWVGKRADATTHLLENQDHGLAAVVCLGDVSRRSPVDVAALLVHEAVHVWQAFCEHIGEKSPSDEFEAYSVQSISYELLSAFAQQSKRRARVRERST